MPTSRFQSRGDIDVATGYWKDSTSDVKNNPWRYGMNWTLPDLQIPHEYSNSVEETNMVDPNAEPLVAVIGVGYVGTHLVSAFSSQYNVIGFDISENRIRQLQNEFDNVDKVKLTTQETDLRKATHFLISVPTLLLPDKSVDTSYLRSALRMIETYARQGSTVVIESSVALGMTRNLLGPLASSRKFFAGMSPERVDPGRTEPPIRSIPKVISGLDDVVPGSLSSIMRLYTRVFDTVVPVANTETAEMVKLYENCQRMMVIAYANEMADACEPHGIDPFEVCHAAATKPFGYLPVQPGLGIGGHCIPVNPYYLLSNSHFPLLQASSEKMSQRPKEIAKRALRRLFADRNQRDSGMIIEKRMLIVGMGFKAGESHLVNSPGLELARELTKSDQLEVMFADSLVKQSEIPEIPKLKDEDWNKESLESFDMIIVAYKQVGMDFSILKQLQGVMVETWFRD